MRLERKFSLILGILGSVALALSLSRCSPVAPSVQKHVYAQPTNPEAEVLRGSTAMPPFSFETKVKAARESRRGLRERERRAEEIRSVLPTITLTSEQLAELKDETKRRTVVKIESDQPFDFIEMVFTVDVTSDEIEFENLDSFKAALVPGDAGLFVLTVKPDQDEQVIAKVLEELKSVKLRLSLESNGEIRELVRRKLPVRKLQIRLAKYNFYF
jgi:hypothetical protein